MENNGGLFAQFLKMDSEAMEALGRFFRWLQTPEGGRLEQAQASPLAHDADRYAREFLIEVLETPHPSTGPGPVASYLGNWWILNTLTPTLEEVPRIARALTLFHRFLAEEGTIPGETAAEVGRLLADTSRFTGRLESFWELTPEGIEGWRAVDDFRSRPKVH